MRAELDDSDEVTVTCFDAHAAAGPRFAEYQPVLLWQPGGGALGGVSALRCTAEQLRRLPYTVVAHVSRTVWADANSSASFVG